MFIDLWCWLSHFIPTSCEHPSEWSDGTRCARWGWTSGIFAQIQPLVLWPSRMLRASKIRCNSQLATWRCWKPVPDGGFQTSQKTSYFQTFFHWCVQEWGGFMPSVWPFFRWNGWNECFPEFSVPNPYANHQLGVHPFTARWCVVCWFIGPRDTMQGTQSYQPVGSRGRSNQRNTSSHHIPSLLEIVNRYWYPKMTQRIWTFGWWKRLTLLKHPPGGEHHADAGLDLLHRLCHLYGGTGWRR